MKRYRVLLGLLAIALVALWVRGALAEEPKKATPTFIGSAKCKMCHLKEHKTWAATAHATAFTKLKPEEAKKAECIGCHVTGLATGAEPTYKEEGVGCEACHGPGSLYGVKEVMDKAKAKADPEGSKKLWASLGLVTPNEASCKGCHNEKSPTFKGFDFAKASAAIKHWADKPAAK